MGGRGTPTVVAKDKKIIHDYSQQRCILNQTWSGEPVILAHLVLVTLVGVLLVGVHFLGGRGTPTVVAKDEKIIHDYSQQRCILNQTSSGKPVIGAHLVLVTLIGVPLVGYLFGGKRYPDYVDQLNAKDKKIIHFETNHIPYSPEF